LKKKAPPGPAEPGKKSFHRHVERAIAHNAGAKEDKRRHVQIHYQKLNGRTVKRKVTPYAMRGNVMVGFDHKRKETRSYRMERVKHMEKSANAAMDTLRRVARTPAGRGAIVGSVTGGLGNAGMAPEGRRLKQGLKGALVGAGAGAAAGRLMHKLSEELTFEKGPNGEEMSDVQKQMARHLASKYESSAAFQKMRAAPPPPEVKIAFWLGFEKAADALLHASEFAGLGILGRDVKKHWNDADPEKRRMAHTEGFGLGTLAIPAVVATAKGAHGAVRAAHEGSKGVIGAGAMARGAWKGLKKWHQATGH